MGIAWFFLVWALGAHNGHSFTTRIVIDRIVMPTKEVCEAARLGVEEYLVGDEGALYRPGPCEPVPRDHEPPRNVTSAEGSQIGSSSTQPVATSTAQRV